MCAIKCKTITSERSEMQTIKSNVYKEENSINHRVNC